MTTQNNQNNNKPSFGSIVKVLQQKIILRAALVALTVVLTVVLVFALTVAWHVNVVETEGLSFTAETWNFSGEVNIGNNDFTIAPGDSVIVPMTFNNDSSGIVAASITASKSQLNNNMQDRMFVYVDTSAVRNGETVDRIYISSDSSYTYIAFPHSQLLLTEEAQNAPVLKCEWVYDTLGYYVLGRATANGGVTVLEYLSPIEYDYDEMKTVFDTDGYPMYINGYTTEKFLSVLSETDGYAGTIDASERTAAGYYPVSVSNSGYGVWAYLCTYSEIQQNSEIDMQLGADGASLGSIRVTVTGQNSREEGVKVSSEAQLLDALNDEGLSIVTLEDDVVLSQPISLDSSSITVIDLGGYTMTSSADTIIDASAGSSVMVHNGSIEGTGTETAITSYGAMVVLNGVTVSNVSEGITVFDNKNSVSADSDVRLVNCNITAFEDGLWIYGNGGASERKTNISIDNCNINGTGYAGVICNGTYYGIDIDITDSTIKGYYAAVYFPPAESYLTIKDCTLEGWTGLVVKGGFVDVIDSVVTGTGEHRELPEDPNDLSLSGWVDTGDGIYLEANYTAWHTEINISGEKTVVSSTDEGALAVRQYPDGDSVLQASINISGGSFSSDVSEYVIPGYSAESSNGRFVVTAN